MVELANLVMTERKGIDILTLTRMLQDKFGEKYASMKIGDWYHVVKNYIERQTMRYDIRDDEPVMWKAAEERT